MPHGSARRTDPATSHESAAVTLTGDAIRACFCVFVAAHPRGLASFEVQQQTRPTYWRRVSDLKNGGYIAPTGERRWNPKTKRSTEVYALTEKGTLAAATGDFLAVV